MEAVNRKIRSLLRDINEIEPGQVTQELFMNLEELATAASGLALAYSSEYPQVDELDESNESRAPVAVDVQTVMRPCHVILRRIDGVHVQPPSRFPCQQFEGITSKLLAGNVQFDETERRMLNGIEILNWADRVEDGDVRYDYVGGLRNTGYITLKPLSTKPTVVARKMTHIQLLRGHNIYVFREGDEVLLNDGDGITIRSGLSYGLKNKGRLDAMFFFVEG